MSKQRYLLILPLILLCGMLVAQPGFSLQNELMISSDPANPGFLEHQVLNLDARTGKSRILVRNDLLLRDQILANHTQGFYNRMSASGKFSGRSWSAGAGTAVTMYGDSEQLALYPRWQPLSVYEKRNQFAGHIKAETQVSRFDLNGGILLRHLILDSSEFSWDTFAFVPSGQQGITDLRTEFALSTDLGRGLAVLARIDYQDGDYTATDLDQMTTTELGLMHGAAITDWASIQSQLAWQHRENNALPDEKTNLYLTDLRLRLRINPALSGFVHYTNRSCSDAKLSELWLISNYLRSQLKYSFSYDESAASYLSLGAKYSPENLANAVFAEADLRVYGPWYAGAAADLNPDRQTGYAGKLSFHLSPASEINLRYQYRDNKIDNWHYRFAGLGVNLYY